MIIRMEIDTSDQSNLSEAFEVLALFVDGRPKDTSVKDPFPKVDKPKKEVKASAKKSEYSEGEFTIEDVKGRIKEMIKAEKRAEARDILKQFDVTSATNLAADDYGKFMELTAAVL